MVKKNIYTALALAIILTAVAAYAWYFSYGKALNSLRSVQSAVNEASLHEKELQRRNAANIVGEAVKDDSSLLARSFVSKEGVVAFVEYLENLGGKTKVAVLTNSFTDEKNTFTFDITARGLFSDIYRFTNALESSPYVLSIQKAVWRAGEKGIWEATLEFKLLSKI